MARRGGTCNARVLENELAFDLVPVAIFDMDGVLYRGSILMPQAKETLERLRRAGGRSSSRRTTRPRRVMNTSSV